MQPAYPGPGLFEVRSFAPTRLNHVLEHLNDPVKYLAMVETWLAPGGVLYIEVPNIEEDCRVRSRGNVHMGISGNSIPGRSAPWRDWPGLRSWMRLGREASARPASCSGSGRCARHYVGDFREWQAVKPLVDLAARIEEALSGFLAGTPLDIGARVARSL